ANILFFCDIIIGVLCGKFRRFAMMFFLPSYVVQSSSQVALIMFIGLCLTQYTFSFSNTILSYSICSAGIIKRVFLLAIWWSRMFFSFFNCRRNFSKLNCSFSG